MRIYTVQMSRAKKQDLFSSAFFLDITVKSGDSTFAPTWKMVTGYKRGVIKKREYVEQYYKLMRDSYRINYARWQEILQLEEVILACYCRVGSFCHRMLLKDMLVECGGQYRGEL